MRSVNKLAAASLRGREPGKYEDGRGLRLVKTTVHTGKWVLRFSVSGRRREMGLGAWPEVSLAQARSYAERARATLREGIDPIVKREEDRRSANRNLHTLEAVAHDAFEARKKELKGGGVAGRWLSPLSRHVLPKLGSRPISAIEQICVRDCLQAIWHQKPDTAMKAAQRLQIVMRHAAALGLDVDLQAVEKARALLGKQMVQRGHIPSMPWRDVPDYYRTLDPSPTGLALKLLILTATRSGSVRLAAVSEFDLASAVWTIPAAHLKGREGQTKDFRVPLSAAACEIVQDALSFGGPVLFPGRLGKPLSDATLSKRMKDAGHDARPHGFRASFRTWVAETDKDFAAAETALGHSIGNKVERSYQRSDLLEQRRALMDAWARHVSQTG